MIPPQLYVPRDHDVQSGVLLQIYGRNINLTSGAAAALTVDFVPGDTNPNDVLWVQNVELIGDPDAAVTISSMIVVIQESVVGGSQETVRIADTRTGFPAAGLPHTWSDGGRRPIGGFYLMPGSVLRGQITFSGAAAGNQIVMGVTGVLIPRGSFTRQVAAV